MAWSTHKTCSLMKDANAIRANAPFPKEKFISCITIEVIANTIRVKMLTAIAGGYRSPA